MLTISESFMALYDLADYYELKEKERNEGLSTHEMDVLNIHIEQLNKVGFDL